jgi:acetyl esterase/lipase
MSRTSRFVLGVPPSDGRYYLLPMMSGWTDVFASPGTRTTGDGAHAFAIVGPRWSGELPAGLEEIRSPTAMVWVIGRTQTNGKGDYEAVHRFQDALSLVPVSAWGCEDSRAPEPVDPGIDRTPPPDQVAAMSGAAFFARLADLMVDNPPSAADAPALERFAALGLWPGAFDPPPAVADALDEAVTAGLAQAATAPDSDGPRHGWQVQRGLGAYGTDYAKRAYVALIGLGANLSEDAIYPHATTDATGEPLSGASRYVIRFAPGQSPPARAFWSLTMYNEDQYFVENPLRRYAIGDRDPLVFGPDGSLEFHLQHEPPGEENAANWLPAPAGPFNVILRIYRPKPEVLDGTWRPPGIERVPSARASAPTPDPGAWSIGPRTLPPPAGASEQLREILAGTPTPVPPVVPTTKAEWLAAVDTTNRERAAIGRAGAAKLNVSVEPDTIAGVRVNRILPRETAPEHREHLFVHVHGGAFIFGAGQAGIGEAVEIAAFIRMPVISGDYRMPPDHPAPAAMEDVVAVWREVIKNRAAANTVLGGTSAGANLTLVSTLRLKDLGAELPGALFVGTPPADLAKHGDMRFINDGVDRELVSWDGMPRTAMAAYAAGKSYEDPYLSPIFGDFRGFPATYLISGTRDLMLSDTVRVHRKLRQAGVDADLHVYEGIAHAEYAQLVGTPEVDEHYAELKAFLVDHLDPT